MCTEASARMCFWFIPVVAIPCNQQCRIHCYMYKNTCFSLKIQWVRCYLSWILWWIIRQHGQHTASWCSACPLWQLQERKMMFVSKSSVRASRHDVFSHCGLSSHFVSAPDVLSQVNIGRQIDNHKSNNQDLLTLSTVNHLHSWQPDVNLTFTEPAVITSFWVNGNISPHNYVTTFSLHFQKNSTNTLQLVIIETISLQ